ncbi:MAG: AtpZ/AtpI family protein [Calditrichaeota bacterium]|nr:MAG: AtpZ/AtpI family protein [Calditrichota bacterium]
MSSDENGSNRQGIKSTLKFLDLGLRFALSIFLGVYAGHWLDTKLSTTPLFLLLGLFLGASSGFWSIYKAVFPPKPK